MRPNDADGIANSVDSDETAPPGVVWSGSALFAKTCQSENLGSLITVLNSKLPVGLEILREKKIVYK